MNEKPIKKINLSAVFSILLIGIILLYPIVLFAQESDTADGQILVPEKTILDFDFFINFSFNVPFLYFFNEDSESSIYIDQKNYFILNPVLILNYNNYSSLYLDFAFGANGKLPFDLNLPTSLEIDTIKFNSFYLNFNFSEIFDIENFKFSFETGYRLLQFSLVYSLFPELMHGNLYKYIKDFYLNLSFSGFQSLLNFDVYSFGNMDNVLAQLHLNLISLLHITTEISYIDDPRLIEFSNQFLLSIRNYQIYLFLHSYPDYLEYYNPAGTSSTDFGLRITYLFYNIFPKWKHSLDFNFTLFMTKLESNSPLSLDHIAPYSLFLSVLRSSFVYMGFDMVLIHHYFKLMISFFYFMDENENGSNFEGDLYLYINLDPFYVEFKIFSSNIYADQDGIILTFGYVIKY